MKVSKCVTSTSDFNDEERMLKSEAAEFLFYRLKVSLSLSLSFSLSPFPNQCWRQGHVELNLMAREDIVMTFTVWRKNQLSNGQWSKKREVTAKKSEKNLLHFVLREEVDVLFSHLPFSLSLSLFSPFSSYTEKRLLRTGGKKNNKSTRSGFRGCFDESIDELTQCIIGL